LLESYEFLRQKICLMALIEAVFRRKSSERTLTFQEIAEETHTQLAEVEHLVMKALRRVSFIVLHRLLLGGHED
jgi:26S proteasome regulatory subunit N9